MQRDKIPEYTIRIKGRKEFEPLQNRSIERDIKLYQIKIKPINFPRKWTATYAIAIF